MINIDGLCDICFGQGDFVGFVFFIFITVHDDICGPFIEYVTLECDSMTQ